MKTFKIGDTEFIKVNENIINVSEISYIKDLSHSFFCYDSDKFLTRTEIRIFMKSDKRNKDYFIIDEPLNIEKFVGRKKTKKKPKAIKAQKEDVLSMKLEDVDSPCFNVRCLKLFERDGFLTVGDLMKHHDYHFRYHTAGMGEGTYRIMVDALHGIGLKLKTFIGPFEDIKKLLLSERTSSNLYKDSIRYVTHLENESERYIRENFGVKSLREIIDALDRHGLRLKDD